jgi:nucleoside-diphosphate-sugar epimerase
MKIVLVGANGKIGELVQKALAGAGHEIVKVGRKSGDFRVEIDEAQFRLIGRRGESRDLAVHLLSALEGASLLSHTFHRTHYVVREANLLKEWVRDLPVRERGGNERSR